MAKKAGSEEVVNLAGKLTLLQSAALMACAQHNYVNDSGPLHLASATNAPVSAFFCSTIPEFGFGPLSDKARIIEVQGLDCRPCGLHGHKSCPKGHFRCGEALELN
jgi:heptosyltransferase-2